MRILAFILTFYPWEGEDDSDCANRAIVIHLKISPSSFAFPLTEGHPCSSMCGRRTRPFSRRAFREHRINMGALPIFSIVGAPRARESSSHSHCYSMTFTTKPVSGFGKKYVDLWGIRSPAIATACTSLTLVALSSNAPVPVPFATQSKAS